MPNVIFAHPVNRQGYTERRKSFTFFAWFYNFDYLTFQMVPKGLNDRVVLFEFWNTDSIGIPVRSMEDRLLTGLTAQQKGTTAQWY